MAYSDGSITVVEFQLAAHEFAMAILTHDFGKREREALTAILVASYDHYKRSTEAFYPGYAIIARVAGMSKGNAHSILSGLEKAFVVDIQANGYGFRVPIADWKVRPIIDRKALAELLPLTFTRDDLQEALRETLVEQHKQNLPTHGGVTAIVIPTRSTPMPDAAAGKVGSVVSRESAGSGAGAVAVAGQDYPVPSPSTRPEAPAAGLVPESGTSASGSRFGNPAPESGTSASGSRFGNPAPESGAQPRPARVLQAVPESGTGAKLASLSLGTLGTNQDCKVPSTKRAPIGDLQPCNLGQGALSGEKQDLLDQMETLGFWSNDRTSKNNWLKFVRSQKIELIEELLGEVRARMNHPRLPALRAPGAYANIKLREWRVEW